MKFIAYPSGIMMPKPWLSYAQYSSFTTITDPCNIKQSAILAKETNTVKIKQCVQKCIKDVAL